MQQYLSGEALIFSAKKDGSFEYEFIIPEYLPNISKIVKCSARVEKCVFRNESNSAFADSDIRVCIIYMSDFGGKIKSAVFRESVSLPLGEIQNDTDNAVIIPSAYISNITAKPVSARKASVSFSCHASVNAKKHRQLPVFEKSSDESICVLEKQMEICKKTTLEEKMLENEAEITVDSSKPAVGDIIFADAFFCSSSCKSTETNLEFEAVFMIRALYEVNNENASAENTEYAFISSPVTIKDTIEDSRISENCFANIYFDICSVEPSVSFDPYGENRVLSFAIKYNACPVIYEQSDVTLAMDAFAENCESAPAYSAVTVDSLGKKISETVKVSETLRADMRDIREMSSCKPEIMSVTVERTDGRFFASVKCFLEVFGTNLSGELTGFDSTVNLHVPISSGETFRDNAVADVILSIKDCEASIKEGELLCDFEIDVSGIIAYSEIFNTVTDLVVDSSCENNTGKGRIIIYYPRKDDSLWTVAKRYRVNPDTVAKANNIENADISSKHILVIS